MDRREDIKKQSQQALLLTVTFPEEVKEQEKARRRMHNIIVTGHDLGHEERSESSTLQVY